MKRYASIARLNRDSTSPRFPRVVKVVRKYAELDQTPSGLADLRIRQTLAWLFKRMEFACASYLSHGELNIVKILNDKSRQYRGRRATSKRRALSRFRHFDANWFSTEYRQMRT